MLSTVNDYSNFIVIITLIPVDYSCSHCYPLSENTSEDFCLSKTSILA